MCSVGQMGTSVSPLSPPPSPLSNPTQFLSVCDDFMLILLSPALTSGTVQSSYVNV